MSNIADKFLREAFFARDPSFRIPRADHFSPSGHAGRNLVERGLVTEAGRPIERRAGLGRQRRLGRIRRQPPSQGKVALLYRLTDEGKVVARKRAALK